MVRVAGRSLAISLILAAACTSSAPPALPATPGPAPGPPSAGSPPSTGAAPVASPTLAPVRFRAATTAPPATGAHLLPYWLGIDAGIFRQYGLSLELVMLQSETVALTAALNGEVDVVLVTPGPLVLSLLAGGVDSVILGATHNGFDWRLLAAADVAAPADLIGKSVVISEKGSLNEWATREALQRVGVDPDAELAGWWSGANQAERVENLRLGNGQATVLPLPLSALVAREGFTDFGELTEGPAWPGVAVIAARRVYLARLDPIQRFLRGLLASIQRTKAEPELARQTLAKYTRLDDAEAVEAAYRLYGDRLLERVPYISRDGLQRAYEFAMDARPATRRLNLGSLVDDSALQRLEAIGFMEQLYR